MNILITGGSQGIGQAIVQHLLQTTDSHIYYTFNQTKTDYNSERCTPFHVDFTNEESFHEFILQLNDIQIDVVINNYHTGYHQIHAHKLQSDNLLNGFSHNVVPVILLTNFLMLKFRKQKGGKIITILTSAIKEFTTGWSQYVAEKRYLSAFVEGWNIENKSFGITSSAIYPGFINTNIHKDLPEFLRQQNSNESALIEVLRDITDSLHLKV